MFFKGTPTVWFDTVVEPHLYRWNNFRSPLEINFGSFGAHWERRMVNKFENYTGDSNNGDFGRKEGASPSNVLDREAEDDDDDGNDDDSGSDDSDSDHDEDPEEESDRDKTQEKGVIHE